jgi:hypothetical protein
VSHLHIQGLEQIRDEFVATRTALRYVQSTWDLVAGTTQMRLLRYRHLRDAELNLEATYTIRLFSEFEVLLVDHLGTHYPGRRTPQTAEALINRVALRTRIPDPIRDAAHVVRAYRNVIVHRRIVPAPARSFREALSALNRFLAPLP